MLQKSITQQINHIVLVSVGLLILFSGVLMGELALFTEDRQSAVRLELLSDYHFQQFESDKSNTNAISVKEIDPLITIYREYSSLPTAIQDNLSPVSTGTFAIHLPNENSIIDSEVTVRAKESMSEPGVIYYAVDKSEIVEWSSSSMTLIFLLYFSAGIVLYVLISYFLIRKLKAIVNPFYLISDSIKNSSRHKALGESQVTSLEFEVVQNAIVSYQERIEELLERERAFSRNISHEIRSPLMVINGALSNINSEKNEKLSKQLKLIDKASSDINSLTEVFLSLVKKDTSKDELIKIDPSYFSNLETRYQSRFLEKPFDIELVDMFQLKANPVLINALLENLIKNGLRSNPLESLSISIESKCIVIRDFGEGLKSEPVLGHGIGLPLVKDICELYKLSFKLESLPSEGCTASISKIS